uniref:Miff domain-containing protein n=1 Tax=Parastrongyloides trichosuri TaxID=131310 RepID=A0A0N4ZNX0_PARTI
MYKHLKDYKKDQPRSSKVPPYISLPIGESMKNNELEIEKYIYDKPLSQKYSSEDIGTLFADIPLLFDNERMVIPTTDIEDFIVELPNLKPAQEIKKIQLPRKTSEIRMRNIEQMILENPKNMNLIEKCILVYEHRTFKDYIVCIIPFLITISIIILFIIYFFL